MICKQIIYRDFRNIEHAEWEPHPRINVLMGMNAQGKTNLLEGISLLSQGRSFRCRRDGEMVRHGCEISEVAVRFDTEERKDQSIRIRFLGGKKSGRACVYNGIRLDKSSEMVGKLRTVLFTPLHLELVSGSPDIRRHFLDMAICQLSRDYLITMQRYKRLLDQRNAYLRSLWQREPNSRSYDTAGDVLTAQLAKEGAKIASMRYSYAERLQSHVREVFGDMVGEKEKPEILYRDETDEKRLYESLSSHYREEMMRGSTLYGPHRAELQLKMNGRTLKGTASQGQMRSMALALKLAEGEISYEISGEHPVYLFDDVFSELDKNRKQYLLSGVIPGQVIITTCEEKIHADRIYSVCNGTVTGRPEEQIEI